MRGTWLGFLFFVALVILGFGTLLLTNLRFGETARLTVLFDAVQGLRKGNDVRVDGVLYGNVKKVDLADEGVLVTLELDAPITLYQDFEIKIQAASVLGGNAVAITRGSRRPALTTADQILAGVAAPGFEEIGELAAENRENLRQLIANLKDVSQGLKEGKGTIGKLMTSEDLHKEAVDTLKSVQGAVDDAKKEIKRAGDNFQKVTDNVREGKGPVGRLLNDEAMAQKLDTTLDNIEKSSKNIKDITDKINNGKSTLSRLINDEEMGEQLKSTVDNVEATSESIKNITGKLEKGEGSVGRLLQDDELYEKIDQRLDDLDELVGRAARATVEVVADSKYYSDSHMQVSRIGIRIGPSEDKYFQAGAAFLSMDAEGDILFEKKVQENEGDTEIVPDVQLAYHIPWLVDRRITVRGGLIEGKAGAAVDVRWEDFVLFEHPIQVSFEGRDAYNDLADEDIDENIDGAVLRVYFETPLWTRKDTWYEMLASTVRIFGGWSRIGEDPEYMIGAGLQFPDEDIRAFIGLAGLAR